MRSLIRLIKNCYLSKELWAVYSSALQYPTSSKPEWKNMYLDIYKEKGMPEKRQGQKKVTVSSNSMAQSQDLE